MYKANVTVAIPVYNGEEYLECAINSVLNQTYQNFELLLIDNCSKDKTEEICRKYACVDNRVTYVRNSENIGAGGNFSKCLEMSLNTYFMWLAHDDYLEPNFLEETLLEMEKSPKAIMCCVNTNQFDGKGKFLEEYRGMEIIPKDKLKRFESFIAKPRAFETYSLYRREYLKQFEIKAVYGSDVLFLTEMFLSDYEIVKVNKSLYNYRRFSRTTEDYIKAIIGHIKDGVPSTPVINMVKDIAQIIKYTICPKEQQLFLSLLNDSLVNLNVPVTNWFPKIMKEYLTFSENRLLTLAGYEELIDILINKSMDNGEIIENLESNELKYFINQEVKYCIWGASSGGEKTLRYLESLGFEVTYFIDRDEKKHKTLLENILVISPQEFEQRRLNEGLFVIIGSDYREAISKQLNEMGCEIFSNYI